MTNHKTSEQKRIDELNQEANELLAKDPKACLKISEQAYRLATEIDYAKGKADSLFYMGTCQYQLPNFEAALSSLNQALDLYETVNDRQGVGNCLLRIGAIHLYTFSDDQALSYFKKSIDIFDKIGDKKGKNSAQGNIAILYERKGLYDLALQNYLQVLKTAEALGDKRGEGLTLLNIGNVYAHLADIGRNSAHSVEDDKALDCFLKAVQIFKELDYKELQSVALTNVGATYIPLNQPDKALFYLNQNMELRRNTGLEVDEYCLLNIGRAYRKKKMYDKALQFFERSLKLSQNLGDVKRQATIHLLMGEVFLEEHNFDQAISHFESTIELQNGRNKDKILQNAYRNLSIVYKKQKKLDKALWHHEKFYELHEENFNEESNKRIRQLQIQFEVERKEKENEMYRLKIKEQEKRLGILAKSLSEKNELVRELQEKIAELRQTDSSQDHQETIDSILAHLRKTTAKEDSWHIFEEEFAQIYPDFITNLSEKYPDLTRQELKVCALLKIKLSTKEIAQILFVAPRSVEMYRYRIRKKLQLNPSQKLNSFIINFQK